MAQLLDLRRSNIWKEKEDLEAQSCKFKNINLRILKKVRGRNLIVVFLFCFWVLIVPILSVGQIINTEGWPIPDLRGLTPYSITVKEVDGVEKMVEKFYTPQGGHIARISGNGKVFAYAADKDQEPPIDYLLLDVDGSGKFIQKLEKEGAYTIPEWVSR